MTFSARHFPVVFFAAIVQPVRTRSFAMNRSLALLLGLMLGGASLAAGASSVAPVPLRPDSAPEKPPRMYPYLPDRAIATGTGVVICPGGGYQHLAIEKEGFAVARRLNGLGVAAFVLEYRQGGGANAHPIPLRDAQRAIRLVRARAGEWGLDPCRIGIMGFSAGGHLAATAGTHFDAGDPKTADPVERLGSRPDFLILIYPVISMREGITHAGSRQHLLGDAPDAKLVESLSNETQVTAQTPPAFLIHGGEDRVVIPENSLLFYQALRAAGVPAELHLFEKGGHGFGLGAKPDLPIAQWPALCAAWLRSRGLLTPPARPDSPTPPKAAP
jgi:acetyl esterase/lipase